MHSAHNYIQRLRFTSSGFISEKYDQKDSVLFLGVPSQLRSAQRRNVKKCGMVFVVVAAKKNYLII
jgi:hypothetical protein